MGRLQHKRGRPSNYRLQLKGEYWEEVKRKVRIRDGHRCVCCGKQTGFEVHHITYYVNGKTIVGNELEHLEWLALTCEDCHDEIHQDHDHHLNPRNKNKVNIERWKILI